MERRAHRRLLCAIAVLLLAGLCYLLWPHSFADLQPECDQITVFRFDTAEDFSFVTTQETYPADSTEFAQIMDILARWTGTTPDIGSTSTWTEARTAWSSPAAARAKSPSTTATPVSGVSAMGATAPLLP